VIASAIGLFEIATCAHLPHPALGVLAVDRLLRRRRGARRDPGIGLAIVLAVIEFLWDGWRPHFARPRPVDGIRGYHDITRYPDARLVPGLVLFRWDAPLFFANADLFRERVLDANRGEPRRCRCAASSWAGEPITSAYSSPSARRATRISDRTLGRRGDRAELRRGERIRVNGSR
jgi:hypothetical protein